jgi:hypothetical protein
VRSGYLVRKKSSTYCVYMHWWVMESPRNTMVSPSCGVKLAALLGACDRAGNVESNRAQIGMMDLSGGFIDFSELGLTGGGSA